MLVVQGMVDRDQTCIFISVLHFICGWSRGAEVPLWVNNNNFVSLLYDEHCCMDEAYKGPESKGLQMKVLTAQKGLQVGRVVTKDQSVGWMHGN